MPHSFHCKPKWLRRRRPRLPRKPARAAPWAALQVKPEDVRISSAYHDARSGLELVYVEQMYQGIPIYKHDLTLAFAGNKLAHKAGEHL